MSLLSRLNKLILPDTTEKEQEPESKGMYSRYQGEKISVLMEDGTVEDYPKHFIITDNKYCAVCHSDAYHLHLDCKGLAWEMSQGDYPVRQMTVKDALKAGMHTCMYCFEASEEYFKDHNYDDEQD